MNTKEIKIADYNYSLPDDRIAKFPVSPRDSSKLLLYNDGHVSEDRFFNLADHLPPHSLMVFNNTKVIQARMHFRKQTGAHIEIFLLEPFEPADYEQMFQSTSCCSWLCLIGNQKKWKEGSLSLMFPVRGKETMLTATLRDTVGSGHVIDFKWDNTDANFADILDAAGEIPIPPYLNRDSQESDKTTYQTIYSKIKGSVAAPTAGLHFTDSVLAAIDNRSIEREEVTLHVGAGTFKPVKSTTIEGHAMHTEHVCVKRQTIEKLISHNASAIAVGTTSVRTLESLYYIGAKLQVNPELPPEDLCVGQWEPYSVVEDGRETLSTVDALTNILLYMRRKDMSSLHTSTQIIIAPGYEYKIVNTLITNFHQPQSTLLLLVSAFVGDDWRTIYDYALSHDFRFLSYGDSSLLKKREE